VRWIQAVDRHGIVSIQSASTDSVEIGHTLVNYILLHNTITRW
jgi:hypothetical protein